MRFTKLCGFVFLILCIFWTSISAASFFGNDELSCQATNEDSITQTDKFARQILKPLNLLSVESNANLYCNDELAKRFLFSPWFGSQTGSKVTYETYNQAVEQKDIENLLFTTMETESKTAGFNPWTYSLVPSSQIRNELTEHIHTGFGKSVNLDQAIELLNKDRCSLPQPDSVPMSILTKTNSEMGILNVNSVKKYACMELLGITQALSCDSSATVIDRIARPTKSDLAITGSEIYSKVFSDSRYDEGLRRAALKLGSRFKDGSEIKSDFFSDLKTSFTEAGASDADAEEMSWNTAALLSTAGPNLGYRFAYYSQGIPTVQKRLALNTIAQLIPTLDHRSSAKGRVYSLPKEIEGSCNTGKTYHFWFSAYLARRAALETKNPEAAAAMAFQAEKLYQLKNRNAHNYKTSYSPIFSPASAIIRGDLAYASIGAIYGANKAGNRITNGLNVDKEIGSMIKTAGDGDPGFAVGLASAVDPGLASAYNSWIKKFDANSSFQRVRQAGFPEQVDTRYLDFEKSPTQSPCK